MSQLKLIKGEDREQLASLLNMRSAGDATAAYYALYHPAEKVELYVCYSGSGIPIGFLALARTGLDLFRPLAVPLVASSVILRDLFREALGTNRQVILLLPLEQREWIGEDLNLTEIRVGELFRLDPAAFRPIINVLVMEVNNPDGLPRYEVHSRTGAYAAAGVNWIGDPYAEIYLEANEEAQLRDLAISVLAAMSNHLLEEGRVPLFRLDNTLILDPEALDRVGYRSTGTRTLIAYATRSMKEG